MDLQLTFTIKLFAAHLPSIRPDRERCPHESGTEFLRSRRELCMYESATGFRTLCGYTTSTGVMIVCELCIHGPITDFNDGNVYHKLHK